MLFGEAVSRMLGQFEQWPSCDEAPEREIDTFALLVS